MNANELILHPPGGVTINQWKDGSIHFRCGPASYLALATLFEQLALRCKMYDQARQTVVAPTGDESSAEARIRQLQAEISRLQGVGVPVSVNTNPAPTPAHQLAAAVATRNPVTVALPGPSVMEVAQALNSRNQPPPMPAPSLQVPSTVHVNPGPALPSPLPPAPAVTPAVPVTDSQAAPSLPAGTVHIPILQRLKEQAGTASPDAPGTIITGGRETDDGELGPPPASL